MVLLAMLLGATWGAFGRPLVEADTRGRLALEAQMVATALAHDLGGSVSTTGGRADGRFVGRMITGGDRLRLCFDGGTTPNGLADWSAPDSVMTYFINKNGSIPELVRLDESSGATFTVARYVTSMSLVDLGNGVQVELTLSYRNMTKTYTLVTIDP
jgi:hypothetical protein